MVLLFVHLYIENTIYHLCSIIHCLLYIIKEVQVFWQSLSLDYRFLMLILLKVALRPHSSHIKNISNMECHVLPSILGQEEKRFFPKYPFIFQGNNVIK